MMRAWRASTSPGTATPTRNSIASAIGYAELMRPARPAQRVRAGAARRASTRRRAGCSSAPARREPEFLPHVMLRVRDVMRERLPAAPPTASRCARSACMMAREDLDLVPIVDDDGALAGVMTERALARRYIRESREPSRLDAPTARRARSSACSRASCSCGEPSARSPGASGCWRWTSSSLPSEHRRRATSSSSATATTRSARAIELGVALLVTSNGTRADRRRSSRSPASTAPPVVASPLDSYVTGRMITLSAPCRALMDREPLTVRPDDLLSDVADEVKDVALPRGGRGRRRPAPDRARHPHRPRQPARRGACCSSTTPSRPRACPASSRPRSSRSSTTTTSARSRRRVPVRATFDPVGSTATLVIERFRQNGMEPSRSTAIAAARRDPVGHGDPQLADDDRARPRGGRVPRARAGARRRSTFGREMFEATSDLAGVSRRGDRHARRQGVRGRRRARRSRSPRSRPSARALDERRDELLEAIERGARAPRLRALSR